MDMHSPVDAVLDNFISNLESTFSESLHIQAAQESEHASEGDDNCNVEEGNLCGGFEHQETKLNIKCLKKCSTFPYPDIMMPPRSSDEEAEQQETKLNIKCSKKCSTFPYSDIMLPPSSSDEEADTSLTESLSEQYPHQNYTCSVSPPAPTKLVSAMKGSREKQGESQMKLTVKWAPDVYDPVPTLLTPTVKSKKQQKSRSKIEKKSGKKGQKGNHSKGVSGKDKKQYRKLGGTSHLRYRWLDSRNKVTEDSSEFDALDVGIHDSYCGTSFLKKSVTEVHCPVGEAL